MNKMGYYSKLIVAYLLPVQVHSVQQQW